MSIDTSKLNRYKPGYVHSNDGPGYISMLAREDGEYVRLDDVQAITSALEQALTQQRGPTPMFAMGDAFGCSPVPPDDEAAIDAAAGFAKVILRLPVELLGEIDHRAQQDGCVRNAYLRELLARVHTTPQPSADAVWEYVTELRAQADQKMGVAGACAHDGDRARYKSAAQLLRRVADELESLLSAASGEGVDDTKRLDWIARQGGYEFDFGILNDQPGDGDWFVHGMGGSGQGATFRDAIDAAIKEEAGGQDANTDILDTLAFKTENGDASRGSVTYIALVASGEADHQQNAAQGGAHE